MNLVKFAFVAMLACASFVGCKAEVETTTTPATEGAAAEGAATEGAAAEGASTEAAQ